MEPLILNKIEIKKDVDLLMGHSLLKRHLTVMDIKNVLEVAFYMEEIAMHVLI